MNNGKTPRGLLNEELATVEWSQRDTLAVLRTAPKGGYRSMKATTKLALTMLIVLVLMATTALATTLLWQDAGEKLAPLESENGYYETWNTEAKLELVRTLYALGELAGNPDAEKLLNSATLPDAEKDALCDSIMSAYVNGSPDTVTLLSILEKLHGDMSTWSMEEKVWYNELLAANDLLSAEDTNYVLPQTWEITQEQAVDAARAFLTDKGAKDLEKAQIEATMYEETDDHFYGETQISQKGRRVWSIVFRLEDAALPYGGTCQADIAADGSVITYTLPDLIPLFVTGVLPDTDALPEAQAVETGMKAIAAQLSMAQDEVGETKAFFGYINLADEEAAHAKLGQHVWVIATEKAYALVNPAGEVIFVGIHSAAE